MINYFYFIVVKRKINELTQLNIKCPILRIRSVMTHYRLTTKAGDCQHVEVDFEAAVSQHSSR